MRPAYCPGAGTCPHAQRLVVRAGQRHGGGIIAMLLAQLVQCYVHVQKDAALGPVAHHALYPEKAGQALAARYRCHLMRSGVGVQHQVTGWQLDALLAMAFDDQQLAAAVALAGGWQHVLGQGRRKDGRVAVQRLAYHGTQGLSRLTVVRQLLVVLALGGQ